METIEEILGNPWKPMDTVVGNTKPLPQNTDRRPVPSKRWCFTYNNYTQETMEMLEQHFIRANIKYIIGFEIGEQGTKHLQGYIECPNKMRPLEAFRYISNSIHWEKARGSQKQNWEYCTKQGDFIQNFALKREDVLINTFAEDKLFDWQKELLAIIRQEPDRRSIFWLWDPKGNSGKSFFCKWVVSHNPDAICLTTQKSADILTVADESIKTYLFDVPRSVDPAFFHPWAAFEQLKNGLTTDAKLKKKAEIKAFAPPHIIIFANYEPPLHMMSEDRWIIKRI